MEPTLFEISRPGRRAVGFPKGKIHPKEKIPAATLRSHPPALPEVTELDVVRHFTRASRLNYCVDTQFYPLGSCTMKYNPKACFRMVMHPAFTSVHPEAPAAAAQGTLEALWDLQEALKEITGMDSITLAPAAGAHAELTAILMANAYFRDKGLEKERKKIIIPDSAHGTNAASAALGGFEVATIRSRPNGRIDLEELKKALGPDTAMFMVTLPNTLGLFETDILEIARLVHAAGGLLYMDGANMNALMGVVKPGELGFDLMHLNLHKTFSVPHGGGGPGAGVLLVKKYLEDFLPVPRIGRKSQRGQESHKNGEEFEIIEKAPKSIGRIRFGFGSTGNLLWSAAYVALLGREGAAEATRRAVINANYLRVRLKEKGLKPFADEPCMHECVFTLNPRELNGVRTLDIAKRLLDYGFYAPTVYFPLIVPEAIMVEPTETESRETLDAFAEAVGAILKEARETPDIVKSAPQSLSLRRLDEVTAARQPRIRWQKQN